MGIHRIHNHVLNKKFTLKHLILFKFLDRFIELATLIEY